MAESLGQAQLQLTVAGYDDLIEKLANIKKELNGISTKPIKLQVDGTSRRAKADPQAALDKKNAAAEVTRQNTQERLNQKRFSIARQITQLESQGVNVDRLRNKLQANSFSTSKKSTLNDLRAANQKANILQRQVTIQKDSLATQKKIKKEADDLSATPATAVTAKAPAKESRQPARGIGRAPLQGSVREVGSPAFGTRGAREGGQSESINASLNAKKKQFGLERQLQALERKGVDTSQLRLRLGEAITAQGQSQFATANKIANSLQVSLTKEKDRLKAGKEQTATTVERINNNGKGNKFQEDIRQLELKGVNVDKLRTKLQSLSGAITSNNTSKVKEYNAELTQSIGVEKARLRTADLQNKLSAPAKIKVPKSGGVQPVFLNPGGPPVEPPNNQKEKDKARAKRDKDRALRDSRLNSALVGGAFPLQFGQGGFASAGGLIGGAVGGGPLGFGLSLVGTLVGSQIDELSNRFNTLAKALQDPIKSLDVFIEQASLASTAQEKLAKTLIDNGQEGRAESLITGELARTIDPAVASRVDANTDNFNRALSDTKDILGQIVAGPSSEFLNFLAGVLTQLNGVPSAPNPNATPEQRQQQTVDNANMAKKNASVLSAFSPGIGNILSLGISAGPDKDIRVAKSKEVFALEQKLSKEKKTQQKIEEAVLSAQSQGLEDTAKQLSLQAKLAGVTVKETKANKGAAEELERSKFFGFGSGDTKKAEAKRKEIKETAELERKALLAEQAGEKRSSGIKLSNAQRLSGLEGPARDIQTKKNNVSEAQREADTAQQIKNQRIKESTGSTKDQALIKAASDAAATATNKLNLSKVELNETTERAVKLAGRELELAKSAVKGDRIGSLNKQINNVEEDRNTSLRKLGSGATRQEKEAINLSADAKVIDLQQQKKQLQNDLNQSLQSELIIRQGIARQIAAAVANQGAALARADAGANPGNSVLAARAGRAEGDAFKSQNQSGINAAKDNESQLRNQLRNTVDTGKQTELVDKIRTAAEATKLAYIEAGTALAEKIGAAAASLKGARDSLRNTLEGNIDLLPGQDVQNLRNMAQADINRGQRNGILRSDLAPADTQEEQFRRAGFVRSVENQTAQIRSQEALIASLDRNTEAEKNITVQVQLNGSPVSAGDRTASTL